MIIYTIVTEPVPVEVPYDSWKDIDDKDGWQEVDRLAKETLLWELENNEPYCFFRHYENMEDAQDAIGE